MEVQNFLFSFFYYKNKHIIKKSHTQNKKSGIKKIYTKWFIFIKKRFLGS